MWDVGCGMWHVWDVGCGTCGTWHVDGLHLRAAGRREEREQLRDRVLVGVEQLVLLVIPRGVRDEEAAAGSTHTQRRPPVKRGKRCRGRHARLTTLDRVRRSVCEGARAARRRGGPGGQLFRRAQG
eukprot:4392732-Prymnesium_polylepis.1